MIYRKLAFIFIVSYLIGSLSFAIIISKVFYKKDIRTFGSGNAGMTNMLRTFGKGAAAATFIGDFLKGTVSVVFARMMMAQYWPEVEQLSAREREVLQCILEDKKRKEIAETLFISENTVKTHISKLYSKLGVANRRELLFQLVQRQRGDSSSAG